MSHILIDEKPSPEELVLAHYGVLGMKWGVRKDRSSGSSGGRFRRKKKEPFTIADNYSKRKFDNDRRQYGKRGAKRINERLKSGKDLKTARKEEDVVLKKNTAVVGTTATLAYLAVRHGPMITRTLKKVLTTVALEVAKSKQTKAGAKAAADLFSDTRGIANYKTVNLVFDPKTKVWG